MDDYSLVPVEHQPEFESVSLVPVDHDPFSGDGVATQQAQAQLQTQFQLAQAQSVPAQQGQANAQSDQTAIQPTQAQAAQLGTQLAQFQQAQPPQPTLKTAQPQTGDMSAAAPASDRDGPSFGKRLVQGAVDAVPGAYYARLAQEQFRQGNYGAAAIYEAVAFGDAALGAATLGAGRRLRAGARAAETALTAESQAAGRAAAEVAEGAAPAAEETGARLQTLTDAIPRTPASRAAKKGYKGIGTTANGGPTFVGSEHLYPAAEGQRSVVKIKLTGSRRNDYDLANELGGFAKTPKGYSWHHVDDFNPQTGTSSLELVDMGVHVATNPHIGSVAQYEKHHGVRYRR